MLEDPVTDLDARSFLWEYFGTAGRAMFTMFQWMFTGGWGAPAVRLVRDCNGYYILFVLGYVLFANVALTQIVGAMLIKETLAAVSKDSDLVAEESKSKNS